MKNLKAKRPNPINDNHLYRPGVGLFIINKEKKVFLGKRKNIKRNTGWQLPQGGIVPGETPSEAVMREMKEEIGSNNAVILGATKNWYRYDIPDTSIPKVWRGRYIGQIQKWFLIYFNGQDEDINIYTKEPEFDNWRWEKITNIERIVVPFKKKLYYSIIREFQYLL